VEWKLRKRSSRRTEVLHPFAQMQLAIVTSHCSEKGIENKLSDLIRELIILASDLFQHIVGIV